MSDPLSIGLSGLLAFSRGLTTTSHNIANAATPGYSRQRVDFSTRQAFGTGAGFFGSGAQVQTVRRIYNEFTTGTLRAAEAEFSRLQTLESLMSGVDDFLADADNGVGSALQRFFNSLDDASLDPRSAPARQIVVDEAQAMARSFNALDRRLDDIEREVNSRLSTAVSEMNVLAESIARLNREIVVAGAATGQPPNDLLDARDLRIQELSSLIGVTTVEQDDGAINVYIGSGQALVTGTAVSTFDTLPGTYDLNRLDVAVTGSFGTTRVSDGLAGGAIGGLLQFRSEVLDPTRNTIGLVALGVADGLNSQHQAGMTPAGTLGAALFDAGAPQVLAAGSNAGTGAATASVTDLGALGGDSYTLRYDGAAYTLQNAATGQAVALGGSGTVADPFVAEGLSIVVAPGAVAGDSFLIRPTAAASGALTLVMDDPDALALASPVRTGSGIGNSGDGVISPGEVVDAGDPGLLSSAVIEFTAPDAYTIDGAGPFAYTSGDPIDLDGRRVVISGTPAAGDTFTVEANLGGDGDNRNALAMAGLSSTGLLAGGEVTLQQGVSRLTASVGSQARQAQIAFDAQSLVYTAALEQRESASGVNLDEEAANLLRFQNAYQAAAQVIDVTNNLFQTLIEAFR